MQHAAAAHRPAPSTPSLLTLRHLIPRSPQLPIVSLAEHVERDRGFTAMLRAMRETGGLMRGHELADLLVQRGAGDAACLTRWIVERQLLSFDWRGKLWIPMFQFELAGMRLKSEVRHIAAELAPAFDDWSLALWFATPNSWLQERLPAEALEDDFPAVLQAARADRFVALG